MNGLARHAMVGAWVDTAASSSEYPVMNRTRARGCSSARRRASSRPPMRGMLRSVSTSSNGAARAAISSSAAAPSTATATR